MQDIRKPYTRSRSSEDLHARLERFQSGRKTDYNYDDEEPVRIPVRGVGSSSSRPQTRRRNPDYEEDLDWQDENPYRGEVRSVRPIVKRKNYRTKPSSFLFGALLFLFFLGAGLYTFIFDSATITVVPKYRDVQDFSKVITFSKDNTSSSSVPFVVETTSLSKSKVLTQSESRKVETKASGKITIYNNYDDTPQRLIKNTRFESSGGKIYRINESVEVPGKKGSTPGSIEVMVYADATGAEYNVASTEFTIPGFKGTPRYDNFYAKTSGAITGGASGTKSLVSLADINAAKDSLALELEKEIKTELSKIQKDGYVAMLDAAQIVYSDNEEELLNGGGEIYKVTATGYLMMASSRALASAVASSVVGYNKEPVSLGYLDQVDFTRRDSQGIVNATSVPILVEGDPRVVWVVDKESIQDMVVGQDTDDFKILMKSVDSIESAEMRFSPMWLSSFPSSKEKISVLESLPKR